MGPCVRRDDAK